MTLERGAQDG